MDSTRIRVVCGTGMGPTKVASYDAALQTAGVHNYNLVTVSSIVPDGVPIDICDVAPNLGPIGGQLTVVQARATIEGTGRVTAALGWTREANQGPGVFYETGGEFDATEARRRVECGLEHARKLRGWSLDGPSIEVASIQAEGEEFATAVVLALYGSADQLV